MTKSKNIALFCDGTVGLEIARFIVDMYPEDLSAIVLIRESEIEKKVLPLVSKSALIIYEDEVIDCNKEQTLEKLNLDFIILAWWPKIIKPDVIGIPKFGVINFHPSFLPYNRGKHYNFWTLVEGTPFGVTLHFVNEEIDSGDILFQKKIEKSWLDTGKTLYLKAQENIIDLFKVNYRLIRENILHPIRQKLDDGSFHYAKELEQASFIELGKNYRLRDLLNIIRAKTFTPYPGSYFCFCENRFELFSSITRLAMNDFSEYVVSLDEEICPCELFLHSDNTIKKSVSLKFIDENNVYQAIIEIRKR